MATSSRVSEEEYLRLEHAAAVKHEYRDGEIVAMAGNTFDHSLITTNAIGEIHNRPAGSSCRVFDSNLRVKSPLTRRYSYPDALVICGAPVFEPRDKRSTVMNPKLIVEVLSESTEAYDRGEKFFSYISIESLEEYVLISQREARVETFVRQAGAGWLFNHATGVSSSVRLVSLGIEIRLAEIYAGAQFPRTEPDDTASDKTDVTKASG